MKNSDLIRVAIAESSVIIRGGIVTALRRLPNMRIQPVELLSGEAIYDCMNSQSPDILIVNPAFEGIFDVTKFRETFPNQRMRIVALVTTIHNDSLLAKYDDVISIFDDLDSLRNKILRLQDLTGMDEAEEVQEQLSQREKEIVVCVVKGMTNKEIAEQLFLSVHTVITHRRNISRKLQIHSASGLTIYAIVNKLVKLSDVKGL